MQPCAHQPEGCWKDAFTCGILPLTTNTITFCGFKYNALYMSKYELFTSISCWRLKVFFRTQYHSICSLHVVAKGSKYHCGTCRPQSQDTASPMHLLYRIYHMWSDTGALQSRNTTMRHMLHFFNMHPSGPPSASSACTCMSRYLTTLCLATLDAQSLVRFCLSCFLGPYDHTAWHPKQGVWHELTGKTPTERPNMRMPRGGCEAMLRELEKV